MKNVKKFENKENIYNCNHLWKDINLLAINIIQLYAESASFVKVCHHENKFI